MSVAPGSVHTWRSESVHPLQNPTAMCATKLLLARYFHLTVLHGLCYLSKRTGMRLTSWQDVCLCTTALPRDRAWRQPPPRPDPPRARA